VVVHRGTIASGELVIKNGKLRDHLAEEYVILCFEMEAAGALADFPCIVIRGISNFATPTRMTSGMDMPPPRQRHMQDNFYSICQSMK
jgi:nucleoside phosphorylase